VHTTTTIQIQLAENRICAVLIVIGLDKAVHVGRHSAESRFRAPSSGVKSQTPVHRFSVDAKQIQRHIQVDH